MNIRTDLLVGEEFARKYLNSVLKNKEENLIGKVNIINDKETAIAVTESILFKIYSKDTIMEERPYEIYLIDGYWIIFGTLPKGWLGGTFKIIMKRKNGQVIFIGHEK